MGVLLIKLELIDQAGALHANVGLPGAELDAFVSDFRDRTACLKVIDVQIPVYHQADNDDENADEAEQDDTRLKALTFEAGHVLSGMQHGLIIWRICHVILPELAIRGRDAIHAPSRVEL